MADVDFDDFEGGYASHPKGGMRFGRLVNLAAAACSLALVAGLGLWGYKLAVRDVTGVPVMRAMADPMRIAPENPGGDVMLHQGLSVNAVAAMGTAIPLPDAVTLAPRPVALTSEDAAGLATVADLPAVDPNAGDPTLLVGAGLDPTTLAAPAVVPETQADAVALALAEALGQTAPAADTTLADAGAVAALEPAAPGRVRPMARPMDPATSAVSDTVTDVQQVAALAPVEIDPATLAVGTRLVQLGAFDDRTAATAEWVELAGQFGELMQGKAMVVQSAQSGGRTFYRLRAHGFADEDDARRFCSALLAENAACIPVAHR